MPSVCLKLIFFLALVLGLSACRSDPSTTRAAFETESLPALTSAPAAEAPSCDLGPWLDSGRLELFPSWCGVGEESMQSRRDRAAIDALIDARGWSAAQDGDRVILSEQDVHRVTCEDLEDMIEAAGSCLLKPRSILLGAVPRCIPGGLSFDPKGQGRPTEFGCRLTAEDCKSRPACAARGECAPGYKAGALTCVGTLKSCQLLPECAEHGCTFEDNTCIPISPECGFIADAMGNAGGIEGLFDAIDPQRALPLLTLVERAQEKLEACSSAPQQLKYPQTVTPEGALDAVLVRISCEQTEQSIVPCEARFGDPWSSYSALVWRTENAQGVHPITQSEESTTQLSSGWGPSTPRLRKLPTNAIGWTHQLQFSQVTAAHFWGSDEDGRTCCGYQILVIESVAAFVQIDPSVTVELPYISKVAHSARHEEDPSGPTSEVCKASITWKDGIPTINTTGAFAQTVRLTPERVETLRQPDAHAQTLGCSPL